MHVDKINGWGAKFYAIAKAEHFSRTRDAVSANYAGLTQIQKYWLATYPYNPNMCSAKPDTDWAIQAFINAYDELYPLRLNPGCY